MDCRTGCGACCIAPSISSFIPGMPDGKTAGVRCIQLDDDNMCKIFGHSDRPEVCSKLKASEEMCGLNFTQAISYLDFLENATRPDRS